MQQLITKRSLEFAVRALAHRINCHSRACRWNEIILVPIMTGAYFFSVDLLRQLAVKCQIRPGYLESYRGTMKGRLGGVVPQIAPGLPVLIVDTLCDSGATLAEAVRQARSDDKQEIYTCSLLYKAIPELKLPDFTQLSIPNVFVVGYGLDYKGRFRDLETLYELEEGDYEDDRGQLNLAYE